MQSKSAFRFLMPIIAVVALSVLASCVTNKKYGCPNKLQLTSLIR